MVLLTLCCACSGGGTGPGNVTGPVASIAVDAATTTSVFIGSTISLVASAHNSSGAAIGGQTFTWSSANPLVATVSPAGVVTGFANLSNVFSTSLPALASTYQSWAIAQYVDGTGVSSKPAYSNPSWNYRSVLPNALSLASYPLRIRPLTPAVPVSVALRGGAASFIRFRVNAGLSGQITPANGIAASTLVTYALVRTF
jgi:hypothetical protein